MKNMKRIFSLVLALVMMMALTVAASANSAPVSTDNPNPAPTGTITVTNAAKGETYKLVQLFKASYNKDTGSIVYTGTIPTDALTITVKGDDGNDTTKTVHLTDYFTQKDGYVVPVDGTYTGTDNNKRLGDEAVKAITAWANQESVNGTELPATSNSVTFGGLTDGYYVVVSRVSNGGAVSVTSIAPHPTIEDKNTTGNKPEFPTDGKVVTDENGNPIKTATVGETVKYTVKYKTVNWLMNEEEHVPNVKVVNYVIKDSMPNFLDQVTITDIQVDNVSVKNTVEQTALDAFSDSGEIIVPWTYDENTKQYGTKEGESLYKSGAILTITYTAKVNKNIIGEGKVNHQNSVMAGPNGQVIPNEGPNVNLFTATIKVDKYVKGNQSKKLEGAKFILTRVNPTDASKTQYYSVDEATGVVTWLDTKAGAKEVTTNDKGEALFVGLDAGDYKLEEIEAPAGYNKLLEPVPVTVTENGLMGSGGEETEEKNDFVNVVQPQGVENATGTELPATGGIGTTIFTVTGGLLMIGAAILFLTKKRSEG